MFLSEWEVRDWVNVALMGIALAYGLYEISHNLRPRLADPQKARSFVILVLLGVAALVGTALGNCLPFALLLQAGEGDGVGIVRGREMLSQGVESMTDFLGMAADK